MLNARRWPVVTLGVLLACGTEAKAFNGNALGSMTHNSVYQADAARLQLATPSPAPAATASGSSTLYQADAPAPTARGTPPPGAIERSRAILDDAADAGARRLVFATAARIDEAAIRPYDEVLLTADVSPAAAAAAVPLLEFPRVAALYQNEPHDLRAAEWWEHRAILAALLLQETIDLPNRVAFIRDPMQAADTFVAGAQHIHTLSHEFSRLAIQQPPTNCENTSATLVRFAETIDFLLEAETTFIELTRRQPYVSMNSIAGQNALGAIRGVMNQQSAASTAAKTCAPNQNSITIIALQQALQAMHTLAPPALKKQ